MQKCYGCHGNIPAGSMSVMAPKFGESVAWHPACFQCDTCNELLVDLTYCVHEEQLYCERHYAEQLKPRCSACDEVSHPQLIAPAISFFLPNVSHSSDGPNRFHASPMGSTDIASYLYAHSLPITLLSWFFQSLQWISKLDSNEWIRNYPDKKNSRITNQEDQISMISRWILDSHELI